MRLLSSSILLSLTVLAASCSKNQYAQVEPDDLYFTHKDRKEAVGSTMMSSSAVITNVEPTETPTEYERNEYSDRHSPVFTTPTYGSPTIQSPALGSPTIQQNEQQPYYDTSVNPDYIYEDDYAALEGANTAYYDETFAYQAPPVYETPQVNNYYYGMPPNTYYQSQIWLGAGYYSMYRPVSYSPYVYDPYMNYWDPYMGRSYVRFWGSPYQTYAYNPWCDPFYSNYGSYAGINYWGSGWGAGYYGSSNNNHDTYYSNGTQVVTKPRQSRNQVSYEVDKSNLPIKTRRADYIPSSGEESGRIAETRTSNRTRTDATPANYTRRGNSSTYVAESATRNNANVTPRRNSSATVQRNNGQRTRTVVVPTRTRTSYTTRSNAGQKNNSTVTNANRSSVNRSSGTTRYSTRTTNANRSSYGTRSSSGNRSNASYRSRSSSSGSSSGTRSSYSSGRSSSRSYSAPSRSSGSSSRSYSPSRSSSSSRSSGSRSSSSSSSGRSTRKN